jgi:hypothetical protein
MSSTSKLTLVALLSCGAAMPGACQAQSAIPFVPVSVARVPRAKAAVADTTSDVVFIVSGASALENTPRPVANAWVAIGTPGTDVRTQAAQRAGTRGDGTARFALVDRDSIEVVVLAIGYGAVRFAVGLARRCHQSIEVTLAQQALIDVDGGPLPPPRPRVVLTSCAPPA